MTSTRRDFPYDFNFVAARLSEAGRTLLAVRMSGLRPAGMRGYWPDIPGAESGTDRPATPSPRRISEMDEALPWISLIPEHEVELRKLVGARSLTSPRSGKPVFSWSQLGRQLGCSPATAKTWWIKGVDMIVRRLNQPGLCERQGARGTRQATADALARAQASTCPREVEIA